MTKIVKKIMNYKKVYFTLETKKLPSSCRNCLFVFFRRSSYSQYKIIQICDSLFNFF